MTGWTTTWTELVRAHSPRALPATYGFVGLILALYACQLILAGSVAQSVAATVIPEPPSYEYILLTPWLHSYHLHLLRNAAVFLLLGLWTERRVGSLPFTGAVLMAGYSTNLLPAIVGFGGLGVGASGITNMLLGYVTGSQLLQFWAVGDRAVPTVHRAVIHMMAFLLGLLFVLDTLGEFLGVVPAAEGVATGAHMWGVLLGVGWLFLRERSVRVSRLRSPVSVTF